MAQLKEVVDIYLGVTHTPEYVDKGVSFLSVKDISGGEICFDDCKYISEDEYNGLPQGAKPQIGDMLFCRVGTIGKPIIIPEGTPKFGSFVSLGYLRNKDSTKCNLEYLRYWMFSKAFERQVYSNVKGASQVNLNTGWLSEFEVNLPAINSQAVIIKKLDRCSSIISRRKQELEELDNLIKSRFVEMFGNPVLNSMDWLVEKLGDITTKIGSGATPKGGKESYREDGISLIRSMNVHNGSFEYKELAHISDEQAERLDNVTLEVDDVLLNITGASVARCCIVPKDVLPARVNQHVCIIRCKKYISPSFLSHLLIENNYQDLLWRIAGSGATREAITKQQVEELAIIMPPKELQQEFTNFVKQVTKLKFEVQKSLNETQILIDSLMQQYFG